MKERILRAGVVAVAAAVSASLPAATALAAPPSNDARAAAQALGALPATVRGTTVEATLESDEPPSCAPIKGSVWFSFIAGSGREVLAALDAAGDMDAVVEVFTRERSQLEPVTCERTNSRGEVTLDIDAEAGTTYVIRVAPRANSVADAFTLRVAIPDAPARPPGRALGVNGADGAVDRFANPDDAWAVRLAAGRTYRFNLVTAGNGCVRASLLRTGGGGFADSSALRSLACDGHTVFTPAASGVHSILVRAPRASRERLRYHVQVGRAEADDTAPGRLLDDDGRSRGALRGGALDALDLYRFSIARRSDVRLRLRTPGAVDLVLLDDAGRRRACACGSAGDIRLDRRLRPGRYFVALRARNGSGGRYVLSRLTRTITRSRTLAGGRRSAAVPPGGAVPLSVRVTPAVAGRATLTVERFDPLAGWLFAATLRSRVSAGLATVAFRPPSVGRWRVAGAFDGTRTASPSDGGTAWFRVVEALDPPG